MLTHVYTCIYVYIHTYIHPCMHAYIHPCLRDTYLHTYLHTYTHTNIYMYMYRHTNTRMYTNTDINEIGMHKFQNCEASKFLRGIIMRNAKPPKQRPDSKGTGSSAQCVGLSQNRVRIVLVRNLKTCPTDS